MTQELAEMARQQQQPMSNPSPIDTNKLKKTKQQYLKVLQEKVAIEIENEQLRQKIDDLTIEPVSITEEREQELTQEITVNF